MLVTYAQWAYVLSCAHFCVDSKKCFILKRGPPRYYSSNPGLRILLSLLGLSRARDRAEVDSSERDRAEQDEAAAIFFRPLFPL